MAQTQKIVTRFAPSPTGYLHLGGARTALFNYLFAKHHGGDYKLRIEDTDRARSTPDAIEVILRGLEWLGIKHDGDFVLQSNNIARHVAVAEGLVKKGLAYECYMTADELEALRKEQEAKKLPLKYDGRWRDRDETDRKKMAGNGAKPTIRIKMPQAGATTINDAVQGSVTVQNSELDDFILLRSDRTPTYMLSVVVDDVDMGVTHIIRGNDHLTNAFRQYHLFKAIAGDEKNIPAFAHIPLIMNEAGEKLSKRNGAAAITDYQTMGILPEAMVNYLLRLGWSHGDDEIISMAQAVEWFDIAHVGKSAARTDIKKLQHLAGHYMAMADDARLANLASITEGKQFIPLIKTRVFNLVDLEKQVALLLTTPAFPLTAATLQTELQNKKQTLLSACEFLSSQENWGKQNLHDAVKFWGEAQGLKMKDIAPAIRLALTGLEHSPGCFDLLAVCGKTESLARLDAAIKSLL
ncbi:MAG: glutamate--tRNA ligase [Hydrotalea sp.]|nr:glutamate--tRNA ligase [Hydrotalea sp.]